MIVWVQLPAFPIHFYHKEVLFSLGNMIGRTIKLDYHTLHQQRARFARIAVEIDLSKPLITRVRLDGAWQYLEYENLPVCCFECGKVGHTKESCPNLRSPSPQRSIVVAGGSPAPEPVTAPEEKSGFGPWMLVTRKSRRGGSNTEKGNNPDSFHNQNEIQGKGGKGKATVKEGHTNAEHQHEASGAGTQRLERAISGEKLERDRGTMAKKKGKAGAEISDGKERGKGILGPVPKKQQPNSQRPKSVSLKADGPSSSGTKPIQSPSPRKEFNDGLDQAPSPPSLTTVSTAKGTTIQLVTPSQTDARTDQQKMEITPSASARTKNQNKQRKKLKSPSKASRPIVTKALQVWTPVKERKGKTRSKLAALTLQEIEAWTGAACRSEDPESTRTITGDSSSAATERDPQLVAP
ncbi:unnamed protein product [Linum tenue]|uniref:CCHC-type domain-containing protein n=1 Tax=Linum tenue TaxID=586396 RepID=A0AAV0KBA0_9ROSI|nr:unnamed protein product [Linum tenue]